MKSERKSSKHSSGRTVSSKKANEILRLASAHFAKAEFDRNQR